MPLKRFCVYPGCKNLVDITERYCPKHKYDPKEREAQRQKRYDETVRHGRDASLAAFYQSGEWEAKRAYIINLYDGVDLYSYYVKHRIVTATMVHHIFPVRTHWDLRLDDGNLIPLSAKSHGEIESLYKGQEEQMERLLLGLIRQWREEFGEETTPGGAEKV